MNDNECFKWCLVRNLHPADNNPAGIRKVNKVLSLSLILKT